MNDPGLNNLLKWGIENSAASRNDPNAPPPTTKFDVKAMSDFLNGPQPLSDADVMKQSMEKIIDDTSTLEVKVNAFSDLQFLVEQIDNANNLEPLGLWGKLVDQLGNKEPELRKWAAWSVGSAVQNNPRGQERLLILGAIPTLVKLSTEDESKDVRFKAITALCCASRNFQPGLDVVVDNLPAAFKPKEKLDATDMVPIDSLRTALRDEAEKLP